MKVMQQEWDMRTFHKIYIWSLIKIPGIGGELPEPSRYKIDFMIDDDPYNLKRISAVGTKCILYDESFSTCLSQDN